MHSTADHSIPQPNHPLTIVARAWLHWLDAQKLIPKILAHVGSGNASPPLSKKAPPLGWTQIEHTEIIPGFLQDALYEKYGAQVRVINVYVHPARTKEVGARLISHLAHISDSCVVLGGDFNQLPNTPMWADLVAHFPNLLPI